MTNLAEHDSGCSRTIIDPTKNVIALVEANKAAAEKSLAEAVLRVDDLAKAEARRVNELSTLRDTYHDRLSIAESRRIDALRAGDITAVATASERATAQAVLLANQVAASAETLRALVASTATAVATQMASLQTALADRIAALEKAQYEFKGRSDLSNPQMADVLLEMRRLRGGGNVERGVQMGRSELIGWLVAAAAIIGLALKFF